MITYRRQSYHHRTLEGANSMAESLRATGNLDVVVVPHYNAEDKARGYTHPRFEYAKVFWTAESTD